MFDSKLPRSTLSIFAKVSALAKKHQAINLGQGYPDFDCDPRLQALVSKHLQAGRNQYAPMPGVLELRQAISDKIKLTYQKSLNPDTEICVTAGATQALFTAIQAFVHTGNEVIIIEPAYDSYRPSVIIAGGVPIAYRLKSPDYQVDWNVVGEMVTSKTRMIIINTPHNPTGKTLKPTDLLALQEIVAERNILVLSDEVYEHLIYDGQEHQSVLRYEKLFQQSLAVYSFGKTLHATGWKLGYCVGPEHLITEFKNIHQWNVFSVNSFVQYAIAEYLTDHSTYQQLSDFFQQKRDLLTELMKDSPLRALSSEGTYFQLYDYSEVSDMDDLKFYEYLTREYGVATIPLSPFYAVPTRDKVVRFCFAKEDNTLITATNKLSKLK